MTVHVHKGEIAPGVFAQRNLIHCNGCDKIEQGSEVFDGWIMVTYYSDRDPDDRQREQHFCSHACARFDKQESVWSQPQVHNPYREEELAWQQANDSTQKSSQSQW